MNEQKSVDELMKEYGYQFIGGCHCDGYETNKYKNDFRMIRWRKRQNRFQYWEGRTAVKNWTPIVDLPDHLKKIHTDVAISK